jgi:hypothetical protein
MTVTLGTYRQRHNISLARQMPVKKASTAGIVGACGKKLHPCNFFHAVFLRKLHCFFRKGITRHPWRCLLKQSLGKPLAKESAAR